MQKQNKTKVIVLTALTCLVFVCVIISAILIVADFYIKLYSTDGEVITVFSPNSDEYIDDGWYEIPVTTVYSPIEPERVVAVSDVEKYISDGWYKRPVTTVYNPDGERQVIFQSEIKQWHDKNWYDEPVARMYKDNESDNVTGSLVDLSRKDGWIIKEYYNGLSELGHMVKTYLEGKRGTYGVYVKNLDTGEFFVLNDAKFKSASVIKIFQMATVYNELHKGNLEKNEKLERYLRSTITVSDNFTSNQLVKIIGQGDYRDGFETENQFYKSMGCVNTQHLSLFAESGYYVSYGSNYVSPYDCGIILEKIYNRSLVSPEYSDEMLSLLKDQQRQGKIPFLLPDESVCANKTGENSKVESDVAIVYSPACDYIICILSNNSPTGVDDIRKLSLMVYEYFNN